MLSCFILCFSKIRINTTLIRRENAETPPQRMSEISKTYLHYTKVLTPQTYFINNFLALFGLRGTILWAQRVLTFFQACAW